MIDVNGGYSFSRSGSWPIEQYTFTLLEFNKSKTNNIPYTRQAKNIFRYLDNPISGIDKLLYDYQTPTITYTNCGSDATTSLFYLLTSNSPSVASITWIPSNLRTYDTGYIFNYFSIQNINTESLTPLISTNFINSNIKNYSYLLFPSNLILKPNSITKNPNNTYTLTTEIKLISSSISFYYDRLSEYLSYLNVLDYRDKTPTVFETLPSSGTITYTLSSVKMMRDYEFLKFSEDNNPYVYQGILDEFLGRSNVKIRPNSTYVTYNTEFYSQYNTKEYLKTSIGQPLPEFYPKLNRNLISSYILNQDIRTASGRNLQTFQLVQSGVNTTKSLDSSDNAIQTLRLNLTSGSVTYSALNVLNSIDNLMPLVTGTLDSYIGLSYISESDTFFIRQTAVDIYNNRGSSLITSPIKTWTLQFPPHNFTLKATYNSGSQNYDTACLNFYLSSGISHSFLSKNQIGSLSITDPNYNSNLTQVSSYSAFKIKTELVSDFGFMTLPLSAYATDDLISFKCLQIDDVYVDALSCFYGPNLNQYYNLKNSPYIPAPSAQEILITYPNEIYGNLNINLKATLSTICTTIDSKQILNFTLSENKGHQILGYPISIEKIREQENEIIVSCATLSTVSDLPCKDLTNSFIRWSYTPSNIPITLVSLDYNTLTPILTTINTRRVINVIPNNTIIPFNASTNTILASGYGNNLLTLKLESFKYDEIDTIDTNPIYFDFFKDNQFFIDNSLFVNSGKTTSFSVSSKIIYGNQNFNIPPQTPIYWKWSYNGNTDPLTQPITAYLLNGNIYEFGKVLISDEIETLKFKINLDDNNNTLNTNEFKINLYSNYRDRLIFGEKILYINDYPNKNLFNVDFKTAYQSFSTVEIANTFNGINTITRPKEEVNRYTFISNTDVIKTLSAESITWIISSNSGVLSSVNYYTNNNISYIIHNNATKTTITLSAVKATILGWDIPNDISSTTTIYTIPSSEFYNNLNFLIYPPYTWEQNKDGFLTLLNNSNYTLANAPTAFEGKKSSSQDFYVSANKSFDEYDYFYGTNSIYITTVNDISGSIDIPYHTDFFSNIGSTISLTAYNEKYPRYNGIKYKGVSGNNVMYDGLFKITSNTIPFSSTYINTASSFFQSPKIVPYDSLSVTFNPNVTSLDLDNNIFVTINQTIFPINSSTSPVRGFQTFLQGNVIYTLSCKYWETNIDIAPIDGVYDLFLLRIGDPSIPLNIRDSEITTLVLKASSISPVIIPSTTFQNVSNDYTGNYDLWTEIYKDIIPSDPVTFFAYSTSVKPKIFISSYYTITGEEIYFQFETPENSFNYKITAYDLFFGDGLSARVYDDFAFYKTYNIEGVYNLSYNVYYNNGTFNFFKLEYPITVFKNWPSYDQNKIRLLNEISLDFGNPEENTYTLDEIKIQPNEWGDSDIFNTSIYRLQSNLDYLIYNSQTINADSPTLFYGWLGVNSEEIAQGLCWHTQSYNKDYVSNLNNATSLIKLRDLNNNISLDKNEKYTSFYDIKDAIELKKLLYVIDGTNFRAFSSGKILQEIYFENIDEINSLLITPRSIEASETGDNVYIADSFKNKIYKFNIDFESYPPQINLQLSVGNLGEKDDTNKFNSPSEIVYENELIFVLDYNNKCIKQYTKDLNWMFTYYSENFEIDQPINIAVHPDTLLLYVLTESYKVYVFDYFKSDVFEIIDVYFIRDGNPLIKLFFDESGDFLYFLNVKNIYKYSSSGTFISQVSIPNDQNIFYSSGKVSNYRSFILCTPISILKCQDILSLFKIGDGLSYKYWTNDQLLLSNDDFADDISYNRSLNRLVQNIKSFRDTLDSRFVIVNEQTDAGSVQYFSLYPVSQQNRPIFNDKIENEKLGVGVNEFHIPQVFNRELEEIYNALLLLKDFLNIKDVRILNNKVDNIDTGCAGSFCWSWKAMSCYNLSLPVIRICNINPITYAELQNDFPKEYSYVPDGKNKYGEAISRCCSDVKSPLN
jgi:hypothetical protein